MKTSDFKIKVYKTLLVADYLCGLQCKVLDEHYIDNVVIKKALYEKLRSWMYESERCASDIIQVLAKATVPVIFDLFVDGGNLLHVSLVHMATEDIDPQATNILKYGYSKGGWGANCNCILTVDRTRNYVSEPCLMIRKPDPMKYLKYVIKMPDVIEDQDCDHIVIASEGNMFNAMEVCL